MKKINVTKKDPLLGMISGSLVNLPTPLSISYLWNMGFMLGMVLMLQIITGLFLTMNYIPSTSEAFQSVIHIMRDMEYGWATRYTHMNGASLFFLLIYIHISRGIYFNSPMKTPLVWMSGMVILLASMMTAFLGYVLPWGQMSLWGATVITSMVSAMPYVGKEVTEWLWGNFSVSQPTINRFLALHFIVPLGVLALVMVHLIMLHQSGSSNPLGSNPDTDKMKFSPYFMVKDSMPMLAAAMLMVVLISKKPNLLGDVENFSIASPLVTPTHIQPEWYFLFQYAILRSVPSKLGGVIAMMGSIFVLALPMLKKNSLLKKFSPYKKIMFFMFLSSAGLLTWIGSKPVEAPFSVLGQLLSILYFSLGFSL